MNFGISLSGGGARGLAHIGVLRALEENNIFPECIAGTSMGAIIGTMYAAGKKPVEMQEILSEKSLIKNFHWSFPSGGGMLSLEKLEDRLKEILEVQNFENLGKKLYVAVTNLTKGQPEIFSEGPLIRPVLASASIPVIFKPIELDGDVYVDGGLMDNLPIGPMTGECDRLIGSFVNHIGEQKGIDSMREIADRSYKLALFQNVKIHFEKLDILIDPPELIKYSLYDFDDMEEIIRLGYNETTKQLAEKDIH